jgi:hypothetical protein
MDKTIETMSKQKTKAFGKDVYLLGKRKDGDFIWLQAASWDCEWYWGFGYIETYTNNKHPELSRDINSHSHWSGLVGKQERYNTEKGCFQLDNDYIHHLNDNPDMVATVLTDTESWELADLMQSFYTLKETAELFHSGTSHLTSSVAVKFTDKELETHINKELLPKIFDRVYQILTPNS